MTLVVILPGPADAGAREVASRVAGRGHEVLTLTPAHLETMTWEHRIEGGAVTTRLVPRAGAPVLDDRCVGAVLNRLIGPATTRFVRSAARDRAYAHAEWQALLVSWLHSLGDRVVGPVDGQGTSPEHVWLRWLAWARAAGLRTTAALTAPAPFPGSWAALPQTRSMTIHVIGGRVVTTGGQPPTAVADAACRLAASAGADVLALEVTADAEFVAVDLHPPLTGEVATAVADLLVQRAASCQTIREVAS